MRPKSSLSIFLFSLSIMIMVVTMLRDHVIPGPDGPTAPLYAQILSPTPKAANDNQPRLSEQRIQHILYGDYSGGGHLHGVNAPCKSEFPRSWTAENVIATVKRLAANDNAGWTLSENGYYTSEQMVQGIKIKVVLDREGDDIITAYPVNLPRNACHNF